MEGYAVLDNFDKFQNIEIAKGRYLSSSEVRGAGSSVVIGHEVASSLFGSVSSLGKTVQFLGKNFYVVGELKKVGQNMAGFDFDDCVIFSYNTAANLLDIHSLDWNNDPLIMVKASPHTNLENLKEEVEGQMRRIRRLSPGIKNNFAINQLSDVSDRLNILFASINGIGLIIAGFSLTVGAFGIANIMFVTVRERTKIIGLKKAIGAKTRAILTEFLLEAIVLCLLGGLIGIGLVFLLTLVLSNALDFPVTLTLRNFTIGLSVSAFVGLIAGFVPARAASRLDPVVAIRST